MSLFFFLDLTGKTYSILEQLQLEEALLRADTANWCLIRRGAPPAIVMGISGIPSELLDLSAVSSAAIPIIRRFTGGGTVVVDENTLFVTLIGNHEILPCSPFPAPIMQWSGEFYSDLLKEHRFQVRENDYVLGEHKIGGNAQSLIRGRFLHHTSFLWDFDPKRMSLLTLPRRRPSYRGERSHASFLRPLNEVLLSPDQLFTALKQKLANNFHVVESSLADCQTVLARPHRKATQTIL